jgi:hypothetical protein
MIAVLPALLSFRSFLEFEPVIDGALRRFRHSIEIGKLGDSELLGKHLNVYLDQMMNITI